MTHWIKKTIIVFIYVWGIESQDNVEQNTRVQTAHECGAVIINCTYQTQFSPTLFWYQQKVNKVPKYMLNRVGKTGDEDKEFKDRFNAHIDTSSKSFPLTIQHVDVFDSAVYYCALRTGGGFNKIIFGTGTNLIIQTKKKEDPVFYKLDNSCLATDFTNHSAVNFIGSSPVRYSGKDYQNYYSSFALREENCPETGGCKEESSGQSRDIERDEKINFISLGLFWLRILFLKTVVFNVLMTFKAWMS